MTHLGPLEELVGIWWRGSYCANQSGVKHFFYLLNISGLEPNCKIIKRRLFESSSKLPLQWTLPHLVFHVPLQFPASSPWQKQVDSNREGWNQLLAVRLRSSQSTTNDVIQYVWYLTNQCRRDCFQKWIAGHNSKLYIAPDVDAHVSARRFVGNNLHSAGVL